MLDPSHGPRQVAALGSSRDSLRLIRRNMAAMRAPQYQIVAVKGLFETEEQYQVSFDEFFYLIPYIFRYANIDFDLFFLHGRQVRCCVHCEFPQIDDHY